MGNVGYDILEVLFKGLLLLLGGTGIWGLAFIFLIGATVRCILVFRRSVQGHVLSVLSSAVRQTLPLPEALHLEAGRSYSRRSVALRRIADGVLAGLPLHEAIRQGWRLCPGYALSLIRAAEEVNQLPQALEALDADLEQKRKDQFAFRSGHPLYPLVITTATISMATALCVFVIPKFKDIFAGMGASFPAATQTSLDVFSWFMSGPNVLFMLFMLGLLIGLGFYIHSLFRQRRAEDPLPLSRVGDWIKWHMPVLRWFERNGSQVQAVEALRLSLRGGATVDAAVAHAAAMDTNACYRKRLGKWLDRIESGQDPSAAAARCGVGRGIAWAMDGRLNPSGSLDALEAMERLYRANYSYAVHAVRTIFWPCVIVALGLVVAGFALAVVEPMAALIRIAEAQITAR